MKYMLDGDDLYSALARHPHDSVALIITNKKSRQKEFIWKAIYHKSPVDSVPFESYISVHFGLDLLTEHQNRLLTDFAVKFSKSIAATDDVCHGLADIGSVRMTGRGLLYESIIPNYVPFDRLVRRRAWLDCGEKRKKKLRGVFWGQLLSSWMVERLGGPEEFIRDYLNIEYRKIDRQADRSFVQVFSNGSMWVQVSASPTDLMFPNIQLTPDMIERGAWLLQRFEAAGLL